MTRAFITGGCDLQDERLVAAVLDQVHAHLKLSVVMLDHSPLLGTAKLAARWASENKVLRVNCSPDHGAFGERAHVDRNRQLMALCPQFVVVFPGGPIVAETADQMFSQGVHLIDVRETTAPIAFTDYIKMANQ